MFSACPIYKRPIYKIKLLLTFAHELELLKWWWGVIGHCNQGLMNPYLLSYSCIFQVWNTIVDNILNTPTNYVSI